MSCCKSTGEKKNAKLGKGMSEFEYFGPDYLDVTNRYKLWGPAVIGDSYECFSGGVLYRIEHEKKWAFYNDTQLYEMYIAVSFEPETRMTNLGNTIASQEVSEWIVISTVVYPGETEVFCHGDIDMYKCALTPRPISVEYRRRICDASAAKLATELTQIKIRSTDIHEILDYCVDNKVYFVDSEFVPHDKSLFRNEIDTNEVDPVPWYRPRDYLRAHLKNNVKKYTTIRPSWIQQGHLGNCWFMCALAAVAEYPSQIEKLFYHPISASRCESEEAVGAYRVTLCVNGWWTTLVLDDFFPVVAGKPIFGHDNRNPADLWVSLIEKAYAKVHGSYSSISRGDPLSALKDLTGFPITRFDTEWEKGIKSENLGIELFDSMLKSYKKEYVIMLNTAGSEAGKESQQKEFYIETALGIGHSYCVNEIQYFPDINLRLFKIRNPWRSSNDWKGRWSNDSEMWNEFPKVKNQCGFIPEEGFLWMEWGDVKKYFIGGGVCFWRPHSYDYRISGTFLGIVPSIILEVHITKPVDIFAILSQKDKRGLPDTDPNSKYSGMMLSIARKEGNKYKVHANTTTDAENPSQKYTFSIARDHALHYTLEPEYSPYLIIPRLYKAREFDKTYVLGILSEREVGTDFTVKFKTIDGASKALDNFAKFAYDSSTQADATARYQYAPYAGTPISKVGEELLF